MTEATASDALCWYTSACVTSGSNTRSKWKVCAPVYAPLVRRLEEEEEDGAGLAGLLIASLTASPMVSEHRLSCTRTTQRLVASSSSRGRGGLMRMHTLKFLLVLVVVEVDAGLALVGVAE